MSTYLTREECESLGKVWVKGHYDKYGRHIREYCRFQTPEQFESEFERK
jgi:hypothetical protein